MKTNINKLMMNLLLEILIIRKIVKKKSILKMFPNKMLR